MSRNVRIAEGCYVVLGILFFLDSAWASCDGRLGAVYTHKCPNRGTKSRIAALMSDTGNSTHQKARFHSSPSTVNLPPYDFRLCAPTDRARRRPSPASAQRSTACVYACMYITQSYRQEIYEHHAIRKGFTITRYSKSAPRIIVDRILKKCAIKHSAVGLPDEPTSSPRDAMTALHQYRSSYRNRPYD